MRRWLFCKIIGVKDTFGESYTMTSFHVQCFMALRRLNVLSAGLFSVLLLGQTKILMQILEYNGGEMDSKNLQLLCAVPRLNWLPLNQITSRIVTLP